MRSGAERRALIHSLMDRACEKALIEEIGNLTDKDKRAGLDERWQFYHKELFVAQAKVAFANRKTMIEILDENYVGGGMTIDERKEKLTHDTMQKYAGFIFAERINWHEGRISKSDFIMRIRFISDEEKRLLREIEVASPRELTILKERIFPEN